MPFSSGDFMKSRKKRLIRIVISVIALFCAFSIPLSTSADIYYPDTFDFLKHSNILSALAIGTDQLLISNTGWFRINQEIVSGEGFTCAEYNRLSFHGGDITSETPALYAQFTVDMDQQTVGKGGLLDVKMDWYYKINVNMQVQTSSGVYNYYNHPIVALSDDSTFYMYGDRHSDWWSVKPEIENHGLYKDGWYWSTVHLRIVNNTDNILAVRRWNPHYDLQATLRHDLIVWQSTNGYKVPPVSAIKAINFVDYQNWIMMGYKTVDPPSYKVVEGSKIEDIKDIEQADRIVGGVGKKIEQSTKEIVSGVADALDASLGQPTGQEFDSHTNEYNQTKDKYDDLNNTEDEIIDNYGDLATEAATNAGLFDQQTFAGTVTSLSATFGAISDGFDTVLDGFGTDFSVVIKYSIVGGIILTLFGASADAGIHYMRYQRYERNREQKRLARKLESKKEGKQKK